MKCLKWPAVLGRRRIDSLNGVRLSQFEGVGLSAPQESAQSSQRTQRAQRRLRFFVLAGAVLSLWMYAFIVILTFAGAAGAKGEEGRLDLESPVFAGSSWPDLRESNCQQSLPTSLLKAPSGRAFNPTQRRNTTQFVALINFFVLKLHYTLGWRVFRLVI